MTRTAQVTLLGVLVLAAVSLWIWRNAATPEDRAIRERFQSFAAEFNASTTNGLGTVARATRLGEYFTPEVVVELGGGSPPIHGRETLIGMAARLQPRTSAFELGFSDITIDWVDRDRAEVTFTLVIRRRPTGEESLDAREFSVEMQSLNRQWRVSRAVAIDTLR